MKDHNRVPVNKYQNDVLLSCRAQRPSHEYISKIKFSPDKARISRLILTSDTQWPVPP